MSSIWRNRSKILAPKYSTCKEQQVLRIRRTEIWVGGFVVGCGKFWEKVNAHKSSEKKKKRDEGAVEFEERVVERER